MLRLLEVNQVGPDLRTDNLRRGLVETYRYQVVTLAGSNTPYRSRYHEDRYGTSRYMLCPATSGEYLRHAAPPPRHARGGPKISLQLNCLKTQRRANDALAASDRYSPLSCGAVPSCYLLACTIRCISKDKGGSFIMQIKRAATTVALGSLMTLGTIGLASPAMAGYTDCTPRGYACQWNEQNYPNGPVGSFQNGIDDFSWANRDDAESIVNNGSCGSYSIARWYEHPYYGGSSRSLYCLESGMQSRDPNLWNGTDAQNTSFANMASSARFVN